jgi:AraC-like DNA-binding protein
MLPRLPRDGRRIGTVASAGQLATLLGDLGPRPRRGRRARLMGPAGLTGVAGPRTRRYGRGMGYREHRPPPALAGLAECGWVDAAAAGDGVQTVLPDGCMDLVWTGSELVVAGPDTIPHSAPRERGATVAGLRFRPGALPPLLGVPAVELHNRRVALAELLPVHARDAVARLEAGEEALAVLAALAARLQGAPPDRSVAALRRALAPDPDGPWAGGSAAPVGEAADGSAERRPGSVAVLADALGCTPRSLHRRCLAVFGYGPAVLRRVLRFRRAVALLRAGVSPAEVAARAGYADQPHLSREVRALAGASPGQLASGANRSTPFPSGSCTTA